VLRAIRRAPEPAAATCRPGGGSAPAELCARASPRVRFQRPAGPDDGRPRSKHDPGALCLAHVEDILQQIVRTALSISSPAVCDADGGTETLPDRRRAEGHTATCFSGRRRPGDCRQRHTGTTQERAGAGCAGEGCDATASAPRYECPANAKHRQKQGTRPTFNAAQVKQMSGDHKRNTGPMLSSLRFGAKTRSGRPCKSPAVHGKRRCRMYGGALGSRAPRGNKKALKHAAIRARRLRNARAFENWCAKRAICSRLRASLIRTRVQTETRKGRPLPSTKDGRTCRCHSRPFYSLNDIAIR
jgi:hypothetical protein